MAISENRKVCTRFLFQKSIWQTETRKHINYQKISYIICRTFAKMGWFIAASRLTKLTHSYNNLSSLCMPLRQGKMCENIAPNKVWLTNSHELVSWLLLKLTVDRISGLLAGHCIRWSPYYSLWFRVWIQRFLSLKYTGSWNGIWYAYSSVFENLRFPTFQQEKYLLRGRYIWCWPFSHIIF